MKRPRGVSIKALEASEGLLQGISGSYRWRVEGDQLLLGVVRRGGGGRVQVWWTCNALHQYTAPVSREPRLHTDDWDSRSCTGRLVRL